MVPTEWEKIAQRLADEIKTRHYSPKTLKAYALWTTKFRYFTGDKTPASVSAADVKAYLTYLAVKCKVSASTQNQAFNALLFLFRHVLKRGQESAGFLIPMSMFQNLFFDTENFQGMIG